jgi:hypothetical protein
MAARLAGLRPSGRYARRWLTKHYAARLPLVNPALNRVAKLIVKPVIFGLNLSLLICLPNLPFAIGVRGLAIRRSRLGFHRCSDRRRRLGARTSSALASVPQCCSRTIGPAAHSMTSSARSSIPGGTARPSALAVLRLMVSLYLVGCCTGRSAGLAPFRIRSM